MLTTRKTIIAAATMFHLHDPAVFPDPLDFNPKRWLVSDTTEMQRNFG